MPNKQKTALIAALCACIMVATLGLSFVLSSNLFSTGESAIILPSELEDGELSTEDDVLALENEKKIMQVSIGPDNVQAVVASLTRPEAYSCAITNTLYWDGGASSLHCRQYARNGAYRIETLDAEGGIVRVQLQYNDHIYAWDAGSSTYYSGQAGDFTPEEAAMIPTYETVCQLPAEQIQQAELIERSGQPMVRVVAEQDDRIAEYVISAATGLLYSAVFSEQGGRTQTIQTSVLSLSSPADNLFTLPGMNHTIFTEME